MKMTTTKEIMLFALFGCLFCLVTSQHVQIGGISTLLRAEQEENTNTEAGIVGGANEDDDNPNAAMSRLTNITNVGDFLNLLTDENGTPISPSQLFSEIESEDGKQNILGGGRMAEPDECSPRNQTVRLAGEFPTDDPNVLFFPQCTRIQRCGGCCSSRHLECVPAYTERVSLRVIRAKAPFPGSTHLVYKGFASVIVDRHLRCQVACSLSQEKCGSKKRFLAQQCDCKCRRYKACNPPHIFSPDTCDCECANGEQTCSSSNLMFNTRTCRCDMPSGRSNIGSEVNATDDQIEAYYRNRNNLTNPISNGESHVNVYDEIPTMITTTTTTESTTTSDPCTNVNCPHGLRQHIVNGVCACRPNRRFRPRPRQRPRYRTTV